MNITFLSLGDFFERYQTLAVLMCLGCILLLAGYIKKNFPKQITLADLGKVSGYSPNHFRNIFTATMNLSPQKYLEKVRIDYAKFLLVQNDLSIAEIAYACGFSSQSYFTKVFKAFTMQTPHEFLKSSLILI